MTIASLRGPGGLRRTVRTATALGAVCLGLTTLSACEKPTPVTTVTVGTDTVTTEAACYHDGKKLSDKMLDECQDEKAEKSIKVSRGDILRLGVEPEIADPGWVLLVNGAPVMNKPIDKTYRSLTGDGFYPSEQGSQQSAADTPRDAEIAVVEQNDQGDIFGVWRITIELDD